MDSYIIIPTNQLFFHVCKTTPSLTETSFYSIDDWFHLSMNNKYIVKTTRPIKLFIEGTLTRQGIKSNLHQLIQFDMEYNDSYEMKTCIDNKYQNLLKLKNKYRKDYDGFFTSSEDGTLCEIILFDATMLDIELTTDHVIKLNDVVESIKKWELHYFGLLPIINTYDISTYCNWLIYLLILNDLINIENPRCHQCDIKGRKCDTRLFYLKHQGSCQRPFKCHCNIL